MSTDPRTASHEPHGRVNHALIITVNFPPDASVGTMRTLRLVRELAAGDWQVGVVTMAAEGLRPGTVTDPALLAKVPAGIRIVRAPAWRPIERVIEIVRGRRRGGAAASGAAPRVGTPDGREAPSVGRRVAVVIRAVQAMLSLPDKEVSWLLPAVAAAWRLARSERPDVIYSSGPPFTAHLVGALLAFATRIRWVADFRDPWARAPWREDRFAFERKVWSVFERVVVTRADAILFVTAANRQDFASQYGAAHAGRFHVVPNGCDPGDFDGLTRTTSNTGKFVLLHAGSLYGARNPSALFEGLAQAIAAGAIDRTRICVRFIGRVAVAGMSLSRRVSELGLDDVVEFVSHMPRRDVLQEMLNASALLIVQPVTTVSIPAKLYEYMAAGRPILALAEPGGETAELVQGSGAGVSVRADDVDAIAQALAALVAGGNDRAPVDPSVHDGRLRAKDIARVLDSVARVPHAGVAPGLRRRPEGLS